MLNYLPYYSLGAIGLGYVALRGTVDPGLGGYLVALGVLALLVVGLTLLVLYRRGAAVYTALVVAGASGGRSAPSRSACTGRRAPTAIAAGVYVALPAVALAAALGRLGALFPAPGGPGGRRSPSPERST